MVSQIRKLFSRQPAVGAGDQMDVATRALGLLRELETKRTSGQGTETMSMIRSMLLQAASPGAGGRSPWRGMADDRATRIHAPTVGIPDLGFKGARQQLFQRFNLIDLYGMAHNNNTVKTAIITLKQEVFRRGMEWEPAFAFRCSNCGTDHSLDEAESQAKSHSSCLICGARLREPDPAQRVRFERLMRRVNIYGQSLDDLLQELEDDLNIADDAFLFISSDYDFVEQNGQMTLKRQIRQLFHLDPIFVEFDTDDLNRPGYAHHICVAHRSELLIIPPDEEWEHDWRGVCPHDGLPTLPVMYRYVPSRGTYGAQRGVGSGDKDTLYLVKGEVLHRSKFLPGELYGYSPLLSVYEKVLSLIGMDRYLYDYFFERQIPQGVITTVTDNPDDLEVRKQQMLAEVLNNPHYIPWLAVSSRQGQGKTEFVRFAYSLDELQFIPVRESLEESVSGVYGIPGLFMGRDSSTGGLNNESQQVVRMSRGAQLSQDVYNNGLLPDLLEAFGITDWTLKLVSSEERSELTEWELKNQKAMWAGAMANMGFGVKYDQGKDEFQIKGEVPELKDRPGSSTGFGGDELGTPPSSPPSSSSSSPPSGI